VRREERRAILKSGIAARFGTSEERPLARTSAVLELVDVRGARHSLGLEDVGSIDSLDSL